MVDLRSSSSGTSVISRMGPTMPGMNSILRWPGEGTEGWSAEALTACAQEQAAVCGRGRGAVVGEVCAPSAGGREVALCGQDSTTNTQLWGRQLGLCW